MSDPIWKPVAAGLLVVGAIAMVARNIVLPALGAEPEPDAIESAAPAAPPIEAIPTAPGTPVPPGIIADSAVPSPPTGWPTGGSRDPFATDLRSSPAPTSSRLGPRQRIEAPPRLTALAWGSGRAAIVDGIVVGIGDSLHGGRVRDIRSDRLILEKGSVDTSIRFWEGRKP